MVYGILKMINFAHSEVFMSGPIYRSLCCHRIIHIWFPGQTTGYWLGFHPVVSMAVSTLIAVLLERIAYRPLRNAPRLVPLITAIGASFFLQYAFRGFYGSGSYGYPAITILQGTF